MLEKYYNYTVKRLKLISNSVNLMEIHGKITDWIQARLI